MNEIIKLNNPQLISVINKADVTNEINIWGRGTGKSFVIGWEIKDILRLMPRSITSVTGRTFGQLLTRTLPSSFKLLEKLGYVKDKDYVINRKPPKEFKTPYETVLDHKNLISFSNGCALLLLSQERAGSSRGPNVDREIIDEALTIDKERYDQETSPANRGNEECFGKHTPTPVHIHHGFRYVSSMPYLQNQKWLLSFANYYEEEAKIDLFGIWNQIVKAQLSLIEATINRDVKLYKDVYNEVVRLKKKITPFVSKDKTLFTLANAFDNIENLGMSYIIREYNKQPLFTFMVEILNWVIDKVEDCYYKIDDKRHIYREAIDSDFVRNMAENNNYDFDELSQHDSRMDLDCDSTQVLEVVPDWGSNIVLLCVLQERNYNFVTGLAEPVDCFINEFFVKPDKEKGVLVDLLVDKFCQYYRHHVEKHVMYYRDRYGDHRQPNAKNSMSYNEQAIARFKKNGWDVTEKVHKGMEPPQHDKYLLWSNILVGDNPRYPKVIFNGEKCKYTLISMNATKVRDKNGKFQKDKSSERKQNVLPEEATHFGDAADKIIWTKYGNYLYKKETIFIPARI
jgi:hypothetical protein